jgi:hypothetical protein
MDGISQRTSTTPSRAEMARIAASAGSVEHRTDALLSCLRDALPYAAAWVGVRDPETRRHRRVGSDGDTDPLARYFALPEADEELEMLGLNRSRPPVPASALPVPFAETRAWGEFLLPAGFKDGVAAGLFSDDGRHLGFLAVMTADPDQHIGSRRGLINGVRPMFAQALDRLPSFAAAAEMVPDAVAGAVLTRTGRAAPVPSLPTHPLLEEGSATLEVALRCLTGPGATATFLSPWGGSFVRVSVIDCRDETVDHLSGLVLVHRRGVAADVARADLQLLGALVEGWDEDRIRADVGPVDVALRSSGLAAELGLPGVEALVQHAAREGLHLPPLLWG